MAYEHVKHIDTDYCMPITDWQFWRNVINNCG